LRPWIDVVVAQFGFDRLLWGGDWPVCTLAADLQSWVNATRKLFAGCSPAEQEKLFRKNAETLYRI
jgi:predicted TIM-barrel fold metal-dependent hydrolase